MRIYREGILMRCSVCNDPLTDLETKAKNPATGEYRDTCGTCWAEIREAVAVLEEIEYVCEGVSGFNRKLT